MFLITSNSLVNNYTYNVGPPVIGWFLNPINYSYKYNHQLSYLGGPTLYNGINYCFHLIIMVIFVLDVGNY